MERERDRQVRFDLILPKGGVRAVCRLENGKVYLEWTLEPERAEDRKLGEARRAGADAVLLRLSDRRGNLVLECVQDREEEEPLVSVLMQPRLWNGIEDPYLYSLEAVFSEKGKNRRKYVSGHLPLRCIRANGSKAGEISLNGTLITLKAVRCMLPPARSAADCQQKILKDLQLLLGMGANCVCVEDNYRGEDICLRLLLDLCDRMGFLVCLPQEAHSLEAHVPEAESALEADFASKKDTEPKREKFWIYGSSPESLIAMPPGTPFLRGGPHSLLMEGSGLPSSLYYQYKAKWSKEPFVYLEPESLKRRRDGDFEVRCYSSCEKVALYSDGLLFEVQRDGNLKGGGFFFQGVPARGPGIALTAESEGCSHSLAVHKTLVPWKENER